LSGPNKLECYINIRQERLAWDKHSYWAHSLVTKKMKFCEIDSVNQDEIWYIRVKEFLAYVLIVTFIQIISLCLSKLTTEKWKVNSRMRASKPFAKNQGPKE